MNCLHCKAPIDLGARACAACGTLLDADGDGVPDVLAKMVEDKARGLLAAERAEQAAEAERKAAQEQAALASNAVAADRAKLADSRERLEANGRTARRVWYLNSLIVAMMGVVALVVGAAIFPGCVEPIAERSIVAGPWFCPSTCVGCRGPGRIFTWHESGGSYEGNVSTQLCHNDKVDIDRLTWSAVSGGEEGELKPYRLTLWTSVPIDFGIVFGVLFLFVPFWAARIRNRNLDGERSALEIEAAYIERRLAAADPPKPEAGAYRG